MSTIRDLRPEKEPILVVNSKDSYFVVDTSGAVFNNFFVDDVRNLSVACASLFEDDWVVASETELSEWLTRPDTNILSLQFNSPPPAKPAAGFLILVDPLPVSTTGR